MPLGDTALGELAIGELSELAVTVILDAIEETDRIEIFAHLAAVTGILDAHEEPDTIKIIAWRHPTGLCQPKTVCVVAGKAKDPSEIGSLRDKDTDTCRPGWNR